MSAFFLGHPKETDLALFAGGESGPFARWRIERHVERCPQCREIAADFFRLPDQLNELADLPSLDWNQMAMAIESGVRADAAAGRQARRPGFLPPLAWQAGLAAATVVVGVVVVRYADQPKAEPELMAAAPIEAPVAQQPTAQVNEQEAAAAEPAWSAPAAEGLQAKATAERQEFASDIAAPAAPPPPPTVLNEAVSRRAGAVAEPVAAAAESAEGRLRSDAAARVGAVSALGGAAPAVADEATVFRQARIAWAQLPVEAVDFDEAPLSLSGGYTAFEGAIAKTPSVAATNRSDRIISSFDLVWIVGDGEASATALVRRQGISVAPGAVTSTGGDRSWRLPAGIISAKMRIYLSSASFEDGTSWSPTAAEIAGRGLIEPGAGYPQLELLPVVIEGDDRP
jgi:hypothetical protein